MMVCVFCGAPATKIAMQFRDAGGSSADAPLCPKLAYATCDAHAGEGPAPCAVVPVRESMPPARMLARTLVQKRINSDLRLEALMVEFEDLLIDAVLEAMPSLRAAARALGISRSTLWRRLRRRENPGLAVQNELPADFSDTVLLPAEMVISK